MEAEREKEWRGKLEEAAERERELESRLRRQEEEEIRRREEKEGEEKKTEAREERKQTGRGAGMEGRGWEGKTGSEKGSERGSGRGSERESGSENGNERQERMSESENERKVSRGERGAWWLEVEREENEEVRESKKEREMEWLELRKTEGKGQERMIEVKEKKGKNVEKKTEGEKEWEFGMERRNGEKGMEKKEMMGKKGLGGGSKTGGMEREQVRESKRENLMVMIAGLDVGTEEGKIREGLRRGIGGETAGRGEKMEIVKRIRCRNPWRENVVVRMGVRECKEVLKKGRIEIEGMECYVEKYMDVLMCFRCCGFDHMSKYCQGKVRCYICSGEHDGRGCVGERKRCANCVRMRGREREHEVRDWGCPVWKEMMDRVRRRWE